jgi:hypothetical protein
MHTFVLHIIVRVQDERDGNFTWIVTTDGTGRQDVTPEFLQDAAETDFHGRHQDRLRYEQHVTGCYLSGEPHQGRRAYDSRGKLLQLPHLPFFILSL